jgi:microcystin-dependent protein
MIDLAQFQAIAGRANTHVVRLSGESLTLLLFTEEMTGIEAWLGADGTPTSSEQDEIEALVALAYTELMTDEVAVAMPLGMIFSFATTDVPVGALECDGAEYLREDYPDLYAALDSAFISDADHFVVPDLRARVPLGVGTGSGLSTYAVNDAGGEEAHVLVEAELAGHDHAVTDPGHDHNYTKPFFNATGRGTGSASYQTQTTDNTSPGFTSISIDSAGSDAAHENRQPYLALRFAIWALQ